MKTKAVRIHGKMDLRLDEIELSPIGPDGVRVKVISDSLCMSTYKAAVEGGDHKRVPDDVENNPTIVGHEFCGQIVEVGENWKHKYKPGDGFAIQPAHYYKGSLMAPGYSYAECGGDSQYANIPVETLLADCLLKYDSDVYYYGSLAEPVSCIVGTFQAMYHTVPGCYEHKMGIVPGGKLAMVAAVGSMGIAGIDYALHCDPKPSLMVVTSTSDERLARVEKLFPVEHARQLGVDLRYVNTGKMADPAAELRAITGGTGFDDVICFAPVKKLVELSDDILGFDGCLNFFAGPTDSKFKAELNFFNVHYGAAHVVGTSAGNTNDLRRAIQLISDGVVNPGAMITHIGGLDAVAETTMNLPNIPGGKKLIYAQISLPLTALSELEEKGKQDPMLAGLAEIVAANNGLWCPEAEKYLLANAKKI